MGENTDISKLLRLKRYEQPPPGYFDDFLREFHRRQRAEAMRRPALAVFWDRLLSMAPSFRVPQFAYGAMAAVAVCLSVAIVSPWQSGKNPGLASNSAKEFSLTGQQPVTIGDSTMPVAASADGSLPPHYVLQSRPVSNEQPLSF